MAYDPQKFKKHGLQVVSGWKWAVRIAVFLLVSGKVYQELIAFYHSFPSQPWSVRLQYLLFGVVLLEIGYWYWITRKELSLLRDWLDPVHYQPPSDLSATALMVAQGVLLALLLYATKNPRWFAIATLALTAEVYLAVRRLNLELKMAIAGSRERLYIEAKKHWSPQKRQMFEKALKILEDYFLKRPHAARHFICFAFGAAGLRLATAAMAQGNPDEWLMRASYIYFVLLLAVSESVIAYWREVRDCAMRPLVVQRIEFDRGELSGDRDDPDI